VPAAPDHSGVKNRRTASRWRGASRRRQADLPGDASTSARPAASPLGSTSGALGATPRSSLLPRSRKRASGSARAAKRSSAPGGSSPHTSAASPRPRPTPPVPGAPGRCAPPTAKRPRPLQVPPRGQLASQTWGSGARTRAQSFVARIERALNHGAAATLPVECINTAVSGADSTALLTDYRDAWQRWHPDLLVIRESLAMLRAEWAYLNRPERLRELTEMNFDRLGLLPMHGRQFGDVVQVAYPQDAPPPLPTRIVDVSGAAAGGGE